jgi:hypothetical protein
MCAYVTGVSANNTKEAEMDNLDDTLEGLVDKHGLQNIVDSLMDICFAKSEHVLSNWQDKALARAWEHNAKQFGRVDLRATE